MVALLLFVACALLAPARTAVALRAGVTGRPRVRLRACGLAGLFGARERASTRSAPSVLAYTALALLLPLILVISGGSQWSFYILQLFRCFAGVVSEPRMFAVLPVTAFALLAWACCAVVPRASIFRRPRVRLRLSRLQGHLSVLSRTRSGLLAARSRVRVHGHSFFVRSRRARPHSVRFRRPVALPALPARPTMMIFWRE